MDLLLLLVLNIIYNYKISDCPYSEIILIIIEWVIQPKKVLIQDILISKCTEEEIIIFCVPWY